MVVVFTAPVMADELSDAEMHTAVVEVCRPLGPKVTATVDRLVGVDRQLLAVRSYLRAGEGLASRWSWTSDEIQAYEQSAEYRDAIAEVDRIVAAFASANPGYVLFVNREVRSLDLQVQRWNANESVGTAARELLTAARHTLAGAPSYTHSDRLRTMLVTWRPTTSPSLAAPGLSPHGQMRAFDFQVEKDGKIIAGPSLVDMANDWDAAGWTEKLRTVVMRTSQRFKGPLASPREVWHYSYEPEDTASAHCD